MLRASGSTARARAPGPTPAGQQVGDRADLLQQAVEHVLGVGVDAPLGVLAVGLDLVDALLEVAGAVVDLC